ncbi:4'-phosphopantetheinyl transferase family protein [Methylovulum miyakonense]|uniref:4'-phosphopantetheinyl transferase family protein n=1 Tax=Methylovulum miyakonense TaxID=645578 RepID=UPI003BB62806
MPEAKNTIGLWHGQLADDDALSQHYVPLLSTDEWARAESLSNPLMRLRHIEVRGRLRMLLADSLQQAPAQLRIARTGEGKPYLPDHPQLVFNISHTANYLAIAIARDCQLGVDIERCRPRANLAALVDKCFAEEEASYWYSLPDNQKQSAFYHFWTIKEAFVKATGRGIALGLNQCVVNPLQPDKFLRLPDAYGAVEGWGIVGLELAAKVGGDMLCGAVVADRPAVRVNCFQMG